jgi:hypothetical protein
MIRRSRYTVQIYSIFVTQHDHYGRARSTSPLNLASVATRTQSDKLRRHRPCSTVESVAGWRLAGWYARGSARPAAGDRRDAVDRAGIGEGRQAQGRVAAAAAYALGIPPESALWLRSERTADALWAAEQVLRSGSVGALVFWPGQTSNNSARQQPVRAESLRRLHLAAQQGETLFFNFRPLSAEGDASPAPLRLSVRPAQGGINVGFVKRAGPQRDEPIFLPMSVSTVVLQPRRQVAPERAPWFIRDRPAELIL